MNKEQANEFAQRFLERFNEETIYGKVNAKPLVEDFKQVRRLLRKYKTPELFHVLFAVLKKENVLNSAITSLTEQCPDFFNLGERTLYQFANNPEDLDLAVQQITDSRISFGRLHYAKELIKRAKKKFPLETISEQTKARIFSLIPSKMTNDGIRTGHGSSYGRRTSEQEERSRLWVWGGPGVSIALEELWPISEEKIYFLIESGDKKTANVGYVALSRVNGLTLEQLERIIVQFNKIAKLEEGFVRSRIDNIFELELSKAVAKVLILPNDFELREKAFYFILNKLGILAIAQVVQDLDKKDFKKADFTEMVRITEHKLKGMAEQGRLQAIGWFFENGDYTKLPKMITTKEEVFKKAIDICAQKRDLLVLIKNNVWVPKSLSEYLNQKIQEIVDSLDPKEVSKAMKIIKGNEVYDKEKRKIFLRFIAKHATVENIDFETLYRFVNEFIGTAKNKGEARYLENAIASLVENIDQIENATIESRIHEIQKEQLEAQIKEFREQEEMGAFFQNKVPTIKTAQEFEQVFNELLKNGIPKGVTNQQVKDALERFMEFSKKGTQKEKEHYTTIYRRVMEKLNTRTEFKSRIPKGLRAPGRRPGNRKGSRRFRKIRRAVQ